MTKQQEELLALALQITVSSLLERIGVNYSVIDSKGYYIIQNNVVKEVVKGKKYAPEIDPVSWEDCELVMKNRQQVAKDEEYNGKCFFSIKYPVIRNDKCLGVIVFAIDITDRKKAEEKLVQSKAKKEAAEVANQAKTEFLKNMRHDLRTPLTGVQGFAELIRMETSERKVREHADNLVVSCRALTNVHNQVLHAIEAFTGKIKIYRGKFSVKDVLDYVVNLNLAKIYEKGLRFSVDIDKNIPKYIVGDYHRFGSIFLELFTNALKYTHRGFVKVKITLEKKAKDSRQVTLKLTVQDSGIGIDEGKKEEIFTRFNRLTPTYEGRYEGLGLGLSIVKQYIDDLKGEIYVASELNQGTTFTSYFAFDESLSDDDECVKVSDMLLYPEIERETYPMAKACYGDLTHPLPENKSRSKKGKNLLLVEDDDVCSMVTQGIALSLGHNIDLAFEGEEAIEYVKNDKKRYDLILMDIGLPDISGNEVTRRIRILEKTTNRHVPIVALTAHADPASKQQCIESGMDAVLSKPISSEQIETIINAFTRDRVAKVKVKPKPEIKETLEELMQLQGEIIDTNYLKNELGYNEEMFKLIIEKAQPSLETHLKNLTEVLQKTDLTAMQHHAHKIAGFSSYCGALRLKTICQRLENRLMAKETEYTEELCKLAIKEAEAVQKALGQLEYGAKS